MSSEIQALEHVHVTFATTYSLLIFLIKSTIISLPVFSVRTSASLHLLFLYRCLQLVLGHQNWHGERAAVTPLKHPREEMAVQYAVGCIVTALGTPKMLAARHNVLRRALQRLGLLRNPGPPNPGKTWRVQLRKLESQAPQMSLYKPNWWVILTPMPFFILIYTSHHQKDGLMPRQQCVCCWIIFFIVLVRTMLQETMCCSVLYIYWGFCMW